ncbi:hypothetical protein KVR01_006295 [Diaporthe batatas]|uniref:uncharacterized protein n=1 Tax=Diaporthe batatas TaxID=748121 RepID=UPI001D0420E5|nr:uncharacterized protein KVR01_006295 [Diaporthe batatas]KAG8164377.1 hypothetical protein KVR01_006295 [Diaporthe batatas]
MLPNGNPILMALATAYCALAAPTNGQPDHVQEVIDALKLHLEAENVKDASQVINDAEASLWADNVLNDAVITDLKQKIETLKVEEGITVNTIAEETIEYLNAKGAFKKPDEDGDANGTIVLEPEVIKQVLDHGVSFIQLGKCPDGSQADLCCVIL